jgi:hypothetical protein
MEWEIGIRVGGIVVAEAEVKTRVRVRFGNLITFFEETLEADWTKRLGIIGAGNSPTANVAEEKLTNSAAAAIAARRHDSSEYYRDSNQQLE